jgi:hypothetical protein
MLAVPRHSLAELLLPQASRCPPVLLDPNSSASDQPSELSQPLSLPLSPSLPPDLTGEASTCKDPNWVPHRPGLLPGHTPTGHRPAGLDRRATRRGRGKVSPVSLCRGPNGRLGLAAPVDTAHSNSVICYLSFEFIHFNIQI